MAVADRWSAFGPRGHQECRQCPSVSANLLERVRPYLVLAERLGIFQAQILQGGMTEVSIEYLGEVAGYDTKPMTVSVLKGLLSPILKDVVNFVNAPILARDRGIG